MPVTNEKCLKCPVRLDCDMHTADVEPYIRGQFITSELRDLCPGNEPARQAMRTASWYYYALFCYNLHRVPYMAGDHMAGDVPAIDFGIEMNNLDKYSQVWPSDNSQTQNFKRAMKENFSLALNVLRMQCGNNFKMPTPQELIYVRAGALKHEK